VVATAGGEGCRVETSSGERQAQLEMDGDEC
jgi:hypothetical protein